MRPMSILGKHGRCRRIHGVSSKKNRSSHRENNFEEWSGRIVSAKGQSSETKREVIEDNNQREEVTTRESVLEYRRSQEACGRGMIG